MGEQASQLQDSFGRKFSYLRLSVTDVCNFRCQYCLPNGFTSSGPREFLNLNEIGNLVRAFAAMGTVKVRLTGGEPTVRKDLSQIMQMISDQPQIRTLALSTNGHDLLENSGRYRERGLDQVNVSVDSLDEGRFALMTGKRMLAKILAGLDEALAQGLRVKLNAVLWRDSFEKEFELFTHYLREKPVSIRFIELMQTAENKSLFQAQHLSARRFQESLQESGWRALPRASDAGPATEFSHPDFQGTFGMIAPYAKDFCSNCNRLRVTARGGLRLCLFGDGEDDLRPFLQDPAGTEHLQLHLQRLLMKKEVSHFLPDGRVGNNRSFSAMGG